MGFTMIQKFKILRLFLFFFAVSISTNSLYAKIYSTFSPHEGEKSFTTIYEAIKTSKKYVYLSVYSWSDGGLKKALLKALKNNIDVRVVLHPSLYKKDSIKNMVQDLEEEGAYFKVAFHNMHEKFVLVDDKFIMNTSANMSNGARKRYSENFVFFDIRKRVDKDPSKKDLQHFAKALEVFRHEFAILWNSGKDIFTRDEKTAPALKFFFEGQNGTIYNQPIWGEEIEFYSSSMNWVAHKNSKTSKAFKKGQFIKLKRRNGKKFQSSFVKDMIIESINSAQKNIYVSLNHFNLKEVADSLLQASRRGVKIRLAVDNQEYKSKPNNKEMTPYFVKEWKKIYGKKAKIPVRVKHYSLKPSPRYWLLNHHKYLLIDYNSKSNDHSETKLITGSYNLSKTAEFNQFDNMVVFKGAQFKNLYQDFYGEFKRLWKWNRNKDDQPKESLYKSYFNVKNGSVRMHFKTAMSLTWKEVKKFRQEMNALAPGVFNMPYNMRDCLYYHIKKSEFWACPK